VLYFFFQAEDGIRDGHVTGVQTCALPICPTDTTPPVVSITTPTNLSTVSGIIMVSATASDNVGVVGVQFKVDGSNTGAEDTATRSEERRVGKEWRSEEAGGE